MTDTKFRGKRLDNGEWIYGSLINYEYRKTAPDIYDEDSDRLISVDPSTVSQFIGLSDRHGTDIYDGDIVRDKYRFSPAFSENYYDMERTYVVTMPNIFMSWPEDQFGSFSDLQKHFAEHDGEYGIEVIGNKFENPELLKKGTVV